MLLVKLVCKVISRPVQTPLSNLIEYGQIDITALKQAVMSIPFDKWSFRCDPESYETCVIRENSPSFPKREIDNILNSLTYLPLGYQNRIVLSCVPAGKGILPHTDDFGAEIRSKSAHYHIPIITDESIVMGIENVEYHLKEAHLYQLDETKEHYVKNPSNIDRVHLLFAHFPHLGE